MFFLVLFFVKRRPAEEGLPTVEEMYNEETVNTKLKGHLSEKPENMTAFQIFINLSLKILILGISLALIFSPIWFVLVC